jgi:hypothetical protein
VAGAHHLAGHAERVTQRPAMTMSVCRMDRSLSGPPINAAKRLNEP